ncbi:ABC transporter permease [Periweissella fabalis]|uniref:ABC transporter permease n=1 Tax=Periweissella fabalis TaxID=1070421 RepID=A0A7X6S2X5_9LACO|nr:ABC transporter permease [Periweissella fabalis]MCM0599724.1 ABC transporter permease [Periweissella fabalis]NKZ24470.1 ABC transporter permease [Periweissella fabalis]
MVEKQSRWANLYLIIIFIVLYLPIFYLIFYSFNAGEYMQNFSGFSLKHYGELFADNRMLQIVLNTFVVALLSSLLATIIGTFGALGIYGVKNPLMKNVLLSLNNILLVSPDVIIGASFLIFFTLLGLGLGFGSVLMSHIAFSIPIVVLMVLPKLNEMSTTLVDAAQDLGANSWQVLTRVILPYLAPGIYAGFFMAFTYSLDDFAVTFFVTGNGFSTLAVEIYSRARQGVSLEINALSALMFIISLLLVTGYFFINQYNLKRKKQYKKGRNG